jgi:hypothetical protein
MPVIGAAPAPIIHQRSAEDALTNALDDEPFGLSRLRQLGSLRAKSRKRGVG